MFEIPMAPLAPRRVQRSGSNSEVQTRSVKRCHLNFDN